MLTGIEIQMSSRTKWKLSLYNLCVRNSKGRERKEKWSWSGRDGPPGH